MADKGPVTIRSRKFIRNALLARRQMVRVACCVGTVYGVYAADDGAWGGLVRGGLLRRWQRWGGGGRLWWRGVREGWVASV